MSFDGGADRRPVDSSGVRGADAGGVASVRDLRGDDSGLRPAAVPAGDGRARGDHVCGADKYDQAGGGACRLQQHL